MGDGLGVGYALIMSHKRLMLDGLKYKVKNVN